MEQNVPYNKYMEIFKNYFQIYKGGVMFCPKCGKEVNDDADVCVNCGRALKDMTEKPEHNTPKTGLGIVMGLFLGIIGLVIGICLYPEGTVARKTFIKAWLITFFIEIAVVVFIYVIILIVGLSALSAVY